jgi:hypothetical protein
MVNGLIAAMCCNKYNGSPLSGCYDDAEAVIRLAREKGWEGPARLHADDQVTNAALRETFKWFVDEVNTGKYTNAIFLVSGHGTSVPAPGRSDPTRELFCPVDIDYLWQSRELMSDEDYEAMLNTIRPDLAGKVKVMFWALCCNSGGLTTSQVDDAAAAVVRDPSVKVRYLRNPWEAQIAEARKGVEIKTKEFRRGSPNLFIDNGSVWAYRSAARSDQYSHELTSPTWGRGDVSRLAASALYKDVARISLKTLHEDTQRFIDVNYQFDQCPQLWAPDWMLQEDVFEPPSAG